MILRTLFLVFVVFLLRPVLAPGAEPYVTTCGECLGALRSDGTVWVWGKDEDGLLGLGKKHRVAFPTRIPSLDRVRSLSIKGHVLVAREDGSVWWWGKSECMGKSDVPKQVPGIKNAVQVVAGSYDVALLDDGRVVAWGRNKRMDLASEEKGACIRKSVPVRNLPRILTLVPSEGEVFGAIDEQRRLWLWGNHPMGVPWGRRTRYSGPALVPGLEPVASASIFGNAGMVLRTDGSLWGWSAGIDANLMLGFADFIDTPIQLLASPSGFRTVALASGPSAVALKDDGSLWAWGESESGLFGTRAQKTFSTPFMNPHVRDVINVWPSFGRAVAEKRDGTLWTWGGDWIADAKTETVSLLNPPGGTEVPEMIRMQDGQPFRLRD